jgi:hypothetical protein
MLWRSGLHPAQRSQTLHVRTSSARAGSTSSRPGWPCSPGSRATATAGAAQRCWSWRVAGGPARPRAPRSSPAGRPARPRGPRRPPCAATLPAGAQPLARRGRVQALGRHQRAPLACSTQTGRSAPASVRPLRRPGRPASCWLAVARRPPRRRRPPQQPQSPTTDTARSHTPTAPRPPGRWPGRRPPRPPRRHTRPGRVPPQGHARVLQQPGGAVGDHHQRNEPSSCSSARLARPPGPPRGWRR